mmetsp:Transcript_28603/g.36848  ORF Transcript_28603/g.36848 Transcript_28603/m.36848 type:complete len:141 (-) Transcript_28603:60-482(-)
MFDELAEKYKRLKWLSHSWFGVIFWAILVYTWLFVIAGAYMEWLSVRQGEQLDLGDAYWFAFISITTVGFGDYYLGHEAIAGTDVVAFACLFLVGFVLFANFLTVFSELIRRAFRNSCLASRSEVQGGDPSETKEITERV